MNTKRFSKLLLVSLLVAVLALVVRETVAGAGDAQLVDYSFHTPPMSDYKPVDNSFHTPPMSDYWPVDNTFHTPPMSDYKP